MLNANNKSRESSLHEIHPLNQGMPDPIPQSTRMNVLGSTSLARVFPGGPIVSPSGCTAGIVDRNSLARLPAGKVTTVPANPFFSLSESTLLGARKNLIESGYGKDLKALEEVKIRSADPQVFPHIQRTVVRQISPNLPPLRRPSVSSVPVTPTSTTFGRNVEIDSYPLGLQVRKDAFASSLDWIHSQPLNQISLSSLSIWKKIGSKTMAPFEPKFCDLQLHSELQELKRYYYKLSKHHSQDARARCNPYEFVGNSIFQNRAGMKLANIDADLDFWLSDPRKQDGSHVIGGSDILYFVDICAGPGGFSEYILHRRGIECKGFGISLRNTELDFNLEEIKAGPVECFEPYYGQNNDGNIYDPSNLKSFVNLVLKSTDNLGVQLALADGGIEIEGQELNQEVLCKQLYLSQFLIALNVLREKGTFVCKLFDTNSLFSIGLIYLMHLCFEKMTIYKPRMSRPQNSERYMICMHKRSGIEPVIKYFNECHQLMWDWSSKKDTFLQEFDIHELVPTEILQKNTESGFCGKMHGFNTRMARSQILALKELRRFAENPLLKDERQENMRIVCHDEWKIPLMNERRLVYKTSAKRFLELTEETFSRLWIGASIDIDDLRERSLVSSEMDSVFKSPFDWRVVVVQGNATSFKETRGFYMSQGGGDIFRYNFVRREWEEPAIIIELPKDTLVFGECVVEFSGYGSHQKRSKVFHLIDGLIINGKDVRHLHYIARHEILTKLAKSVNKSSRTELSFIRAKHIVRMENIADVLDKCQKRELKGENGKHWICPIDHTDERSPIIKAAGILFLKLTKDPWVMALSKSSNRKYWFNQNNGESVYTIPPTAVSNFFDTMQNRVMWQWTTETNLYVPDEDPGSLSTSKPFPSNCRNSERVHSVHLLDYLRKKLRPIHGESKTPN